MARKLIDITGQKFGRLLVVSRIPSKGEAKWRCVCDCGRETTALGHHLRKRLKQSCGCKHLENVTKHGGSYSITYSSWKAMKSRCLNVRNVMYYMYGGSGIKVCDRWMDFGNFLADMGERPSTEYSLDRFPNCEGDYEPGNCRWATAKQQANNRADNHRITHKGETKTLMEWSESIGQPFSFLVGRLKAGWTFAEAINKPRTICARRADGKFSGRRG